MQACRNLTIYPVVPSKCQQRPFPVKLAWTGLARSLAAHFRGMRISASGTGTVQKDLKRRSLPSNRPTMRRTDERVDGLICHWVCR
jgi:hypothetical protein